MIVPTLCVEIQPMTLRVTLRGLEKFTRIGTRSVHRGVTTQSVGTISPAAPLPLHGHGAVARDCWSNASASPPVPHPNPGGQSPHRFLRVRGSSGSCSAVGHHGPGAPNSGGYAE